MAFRLQGCGISRKAGTLTWLKGLVKQCYRRTMWTAADRMCSPGPSLRMCRSALDITDDSGAY